MTQLLPPGDVDDDAPSPDPDPIDHGDVAPVTPRPPWLRPEAVTTFLVVGACVLFVFLQLEPGQIFRATTPAGGDMGAHVWLPAFLKRVLLPRLQWSGWTMDWYAGFPALTYYFPLPMWAIAFLSFVVPYGVAFKIVSAFGLVTLPVACWALGRLAGMRFPGPACLALAAVPYEFGREFTIYGGNIASTMAGEFCFSVSLSFALLFLGLVGRGLRTRRGAVLAAVAFAACGLSHVLPLLFAIGGALVFLLLRLSRRNFLWLAATGVVGALLIAFWAVPFELRLPYATNMGYGKITTYLHTLFPSSDIWLYVLAAVGATLAFARGNLVGRWLSIVAGLTVLVFRFAPSDRLWNARALPFWFLCLYLLAAVAFAETGLGIVEAVGGAAARRRVGAGGNDTTPAPAGPRLASWAVLVPVFTGLVAFTWVGYPLRILPGGTVAANGKYSWAGITSSDNSYLPDWVHWNYSGYQDSGKSDRTAYFSIIRMMERIGRRYGCGRSMYEYEQAINDMGTPDALMLLPYWTHGCISTMEGLYYESSATTPYHFLNSAELSEGPSNPMRGLDYPTGPQVTLGIEHLRMFGVRYFLAVSPGIQEQAAASPDLRLLASVGPYATRLSNGSVEQQTWKVYLVRGAPLVQGLADQPAVVPDTLRTPTTWLHLSESWYLDPKRWDVYLAADGPRSWARVPVGDTSPPVRPEPHVTVTDIRQREESVSFDVDRTGVPVVVKVSYYPNWHVRGAEGPYRITPDLMVVVPTSRHVELTYGSTPMDWIAGALSALGVLGLLALRRWPLWREPLFGGVGDGNLRPDRKVRLRRRAHARRRRPPTGGPPEDPDFWRGPGRPRTTSAAATGADTPDAGTEGAAPAAPPAAAAPPPLPWTPPSPGDARPDQPPDPPVS